MWPLLLAVYVADNTDMETKSKMSDINDTAGVGNIESMLSVEKGLRELASLKVFLIIY
jgi:hypothetical protein